MNAERLLQHFERISEAPDAIPRLRRFILDFAVRGKLVEQDTNDEPAAELLKRIQAEKERLVTKKGRFRGRQAFSESIYWSMASLSLKGGFGGYSGSDVLWSQTVITSQAETSQEKLPCLVISDVRCQSTTLVIDAMFR